MRTIINWFEKYPAISWTITIIIAGTIFYLSSKTFPPGPPAISNLSIFYHFFAFFFLAAFLSISMIKGKVNKYLILMAIIIVALYGISDEIHQLFVPGRHFSLYDIFTDSTGALTASTIYLGLCFKK